MPVDDANHTLYKTYKTRMPDKRHIPLPVDDAHYTQLMKHAHCRDFQHTQL